MICFVFNFQSQWNSYSPFPIPNAHCCVSDEVKDTVWLWKFILNSFAIRFSYQSFKHLVYGWTDNFFNTLTAKALYERQFIWFNMIAWSYKFTLKYYPCWLKMSQLVFSPSDSYDEIIAAASKKKNNHYRIISPVNMIELLSKRLGKDLI